MTHQTRQQYLMILFSLYIGRYNNVKTDYTPFIFREGMYTIVFYKYSLFNQIYVGIT